jgi:hypothetical protein
MVFHNRPFKKDLTPFAKGGQVIKHLGKGAREQSARGGETMTGGDPYSRMSNRYPKATTQDLANEPDSEPASPSPPPSPVPMGSRPPAAPTAMMPPSGGDAETPADSGPGDEPE